MWNLRCPPPLLLGLLLGSGCDRGAVAPGPAAPPLEVSIAAPAPPPPAPEKKRAPHAAEAMKFDGFQLGTDYGRKVMTRAPYKDPCDDDPIDHRARRFMVYGALPCRDRTFPEGTTVAFYLRYAEGPEQFNQPIVAFAWLGGGYFSARSDFPLHTGEPASAAAEVLGPPLRTFSLEGRNAPVTVQRHEGDIHVLIDQGVLVGFVVGPMPDDPDNEQWRGLMQMYFRYTRPRDPSP